MSTPTKGQQPAQVPGDAESSPKNEQDRTTERAISHIDKTEPVQTEREAPDRKRG
jgi:hypothetical protein